MANRPEYMEFLMELLAPLGQIAARSMMGGHVLYCDGIVFALVDDSTLYLKANSETRSRFEAMGLEAFRPFADRPDTMQYYPPPPEFFEDSRVMKEWAGLALQAGRLAQTKKRARRPTKSARKTR